MSACHGSHSLHASVELLGKFSKVKRFANKTLPICSTSLWGNLMKALDCLICFCPKRTLIWDILPMYIWTCFKIDNHDKPSNSADCCGVITQNSHDISNERLVNEQIPSEIFSASQEAQETSHRIQSQIGSFCTNKF